MLTQGSTKILAPLYCAYKAFQTLFKWDTNFFLSDACVICIVKWFAMESARH